MAGARRFGRRRFGHAFAFLTLAACRGVGPSSAPEPELEPSAEPWLVIEDADPPDEDREGAGRALERHVFSEGPDSDADGVIDEFDACPSVPEDLDSFQDADGCPEVDNDHDGLLDVDDKCPNQPETFDGRADDDGCPG